MSDQPVRTLLFKEEVRKKIDRGLETVYQAVSTTLGSRGRNVAIELNWGKPIIMHDGVTVARSIVLKDPYENMGARLVIDAATNTNNEAGDGTTTATILTYAITHEAVRNVTAGHNPMIIKKGIEKAVKLVTEELLRMSKPVREKSEMVDVATISAADSALGELIATAVQKVGESGVVSVQEGSTHEVRVEYKEGLEFEKGLISPYLITKQDRQEAVFEAQKQDDLPYVVVLNEEMNNDKLSTIMGMIYKQSPSAKVLLIANDYDADSAVSIVVTKINGNKRLAAVKSPEFGQYRVDMLTDIAIATGGTVIGGETGIPVSDVKIEHIGRAEKIIVGRSQTIIIGSKGDKQLLEEHITGIRTLLTQAADEFQKDKYQKRLAKLVGGVAVIDVGAPTETEMREKKERVYDAVNATKAAIAEGIVPGGGVALLRARKVIKDMEWGKEKIGADIVYDALAYPIRKLLENAGVDKPDYIIGKIEESTDLSLGYNVDSEEYVNLIKDGIIDPVKVTKSGLRNAASIATMLITTDVMIAFERVKQSGTQLDDSGIGNFND